ncbi:hypothetical protein P389DRAFT_13947 [Cystobasidium minutum MCA 4210]|uniref:uncharacterized protein n=1 Tax=Cystobasidium minutum MCA 4210 TaxID=1397322 RepID=UPI0034CEC33F|eukprot:jgi/Rhomi1/13947/CE13946_1101
MQDYAPDPYGNSEPRYNGTNEGVGAGSAPPEQLVSEPSRTFGRPPPGVAPPCGWAPGNAETNPAFLDPMYGGGMESSGDVAFDPGTGTWIAVSKPKKRKGTSSLPNPMMPTMPGMGYDMFGRPMMAPMGMPGMMMPGAMPGAFPPMYPGMMPAAAAPLPTTVKSSSSSIKSSKKDIKREARKEMKKMLKKEKEEEERRHEKEERRQEKEARRRRQELERQWAENEERERRAEQRRMEEEARARAMADARQKAAREAAERDARERERIQREREAAQQYEQRKRAAHEAKMKAKWEAKEREERLAEARQQEQRQLARRKQALAGIEEAARRGAHSPTSTRNSWLSESRRVPTYREYDDEDDEEEEEELHDRPRYDYDRSPRPSSPQSYRSNPPSYRSQPSSRGNSGDDYEDDDPASDWLDDPRPDTRSVRSGSSSQTHLHPTSTYTRQGNHYQDGFQRPRAHSSSQLEARSPYDHSDTRSIRSAQTSRSRAPSVATSVRSEGGYGQYRNRGRRTEDDDEDEDQRPAYGRRVGSYASALPSARPSSERDASDFLHPTRPHQGRSHSQPAPERSHHHGHHQTNHRADHTGEGVEHKRHHAHHKDSYSQMHHRQQASHDDDDTDVRDDSAADVGDWDFDGSDVENNVTPTPSNVGGIRGLLSSAMQNLRVSSNSKDDSRKSARNSSGETTPSAAPPTQSKKLSVAQIVHEDDDEEEAIYVRSRSTTTSMQSSVFSASYDDSRSSMRSGRSAFSYVSDDSRSVRSGYSRSSRR